MYDLVSIKRKIPLTITSADLENFFIAELTARHW